MNSARSRFIIAFLFCLFVVSAYAKETIKIGVIGGFSGDLSSLSNSCRKGIELAQKENKNDLY